MNALEIEKLNQLVSRTDMSGNQKVEWLVNFIEEREKAFTQHDVSGRSKQCNHVFQRVERGGEFQGNQCECGEWEDLT